MGIVVLAFPETYEDWKVLSKPLSAILTFRWWRNPYCFPILFRRTFGREQRVTGRIPISLHLLSSRILNHRRTELSLSRLTLAGRMWVNVNLQHGDSTWPIKNSLALVLSDEEESNTVSASVTQNRIPFHTWMFPCLFWVTTPRPFWPHLEVVLIPLSSKLDSWLGGAIKQYSLTLKVPKSWAPAIII